MKILFIGGTGNISRSVSQLCVEMGHDLWLLNRGTTGVDIPGASVITGNINAPETAAALTEHVWDVVVNWIAFRPVDIERDIQLFAGKTGQYIFISSASCYQKPLQQPYVTESTPLKNPFWQYSRDKIACEERLTQAYRQDDFPMTIVRPSLTYDTVIPVALGGWTEYTIIDRIKKGQPIVVHGDGTSLWTITHARDFARGFVGLLGRTQAIGEAFHITSDELLNWNQIYQAVAAAAEREANIIHIASDFICRLYPEQTGSLLGDKAYSAIFDNRKIRRLVPDFVATIPFALGIKETVAWFEADSARMVIRPETNAMLDHLITACEAK